VRGFVEGMSRSACMGMKYMFRGLVDKCTAAAFYAVSLFDLRVLAFKYH
jgi:hypothetical protein